MKFSLVGLITYRETNLLYDPKVSSTSNKQRICAVIAHEFAHMWFGNLVTMRCEFLNYKKNLIIVILFHRVERLVVSDQHFKLILFLF